MTSSRAPFACSRATTQSSASSAHRSKKSGISAPGYVRASTLGTACRFVPRAAALALGLVPLVYTVNEQARMHELDGLGVGGIFTDRPAQALRLFRSARH
jgi:glycerophosphoryl diester phosphodiesterase